MTEYWVSFPQSEWDELIACGRARQATHGPGDRDCERVRDDPNYEHVCGYICEEAFATIFGLKVNKNSGRQGDGLVDFRIGRLTIDAKGRTREHYAMLIKVKDLVAVKTHVYVHGWVNPQMRTVRFWGWVPGDEVSKYPERKARNSKLPFSNYEIEPRESAKRDIKDLLRLCSGESQSVVLS